MKKKLDWLKRHRKGAKRVFYLLLIIIVFGGFILYIFPSAELVNPEDNPRLMRFNGVVCIEGDAGLAAFPNKTGSGTAADPYVIENLTLSPGEAEPGFFINRTEFR